MIRGHIFQGLEEKVPTLGTDGVGLQRFAAQAQPLFPRFGKNIVRFSKPWKKLFSPLRPFVDGGQNEQGEERGGEQSEDHHGGKRTLNLGAGATRE